jgi:hypothetical protein
MSARIPVAVGLAVAVAVAVGSATIRTPQATASPPISSISEYVETFPTSGGGTVKQPGATRRGAELAQSIRERAGADAASLGALAASAPPAARHIRESSSPARRQQPIAAAPVNVPAAGSSLGGLPRSLGGAGIALLVVLGAATLAVLLRARRAR